MRLLSAKNDRASLSLEPREQLCSNNVLNEVCHAFEVPNFAATIGISREAADRLLDALHKLYNEKTSVQVELSRTELEAIRNALVATLKELGDWEFPIRVGVPFEEGQTILKSLDQVVASMKPA